jgi:hypothetical protein
MSKIDGIGQKKFSKIITMFSGSDINDKIRADMLNNEPDDTSNMIQDIIKADADQETKTFKSKLAMWETRLGYVDAPCVIKKINPNIDSEKCQSLKSLDIKDTADNKPRKTIVKQTKKKIVVKKKQKKRVVKKIVVPSEDSDEIDPFVIIPAKK